MVGQARPECRRGLVRPLEVVHHDEDRVRRALLLHHLEQPLGRSRHRIRHAGGRARCRGRHRGPVRRPQLAGGRLVPLQEVQERPQGEVALRLVRRTPEHGEARFHGTVGTGSQQGGLSAPGFTPDQDGASLAGCRSGQYFVELRRLGPPTDWRCSRPGGSHLQDYRIDDHRRCIGEMSAGPEPPFPRSWCPLAVWDTLSGNGVTRRAPPEALSSCDGRATGK